MKPSYDFSKPKAPAVTPTGPLAARRRPPRVALIAGAAGLLCAAALAFVLTRPDGEPSMLDARFCQVSLELGESLAAAGVPTVGPVPDSVAPQVFAGVVSGMGDRLDELDRRAPARIRADVKRVNADLRAAVIGDLAGVRSAGFAEAELRISQLTQPPRCPAPRGDGSGGG